MYKLIPFLPINVMKNVYYILILPQYAIEVWGSAFKSDLDKILILQKRSIGLNKENQFQHRSWKEETKTYYFVTRRQLRIWDFSLCLFKAGSFSVPSDISTYCRIKVYLHSADKASLRGEWNEKTYPRGATWIID